MGSSSKPRTESALARVNPLRTYLWLPAARAVTIWFTPRIELLPVSGHVFPLEQMREDDPVDQEVTQPVFCYEFVLCGSRRLERRAALAFQSSGPAGGGLPALFIVLRTAFLTTLETPEPRYVLVCFPALIALGAQVFTGPSRGTSTGLQFGQLFLPEWFG